MNIHIFNDPDGFYANRTASFVNKFQPDNNVYVNTALSCKRISEEVTYTTCKLFFSNPHLSFERVIFHCYSYPDKENIKFIKKRYPSRDITFVWNFWSHEYYQLPEFLPSLYQGFSKKFFLRKVLYFYVNQLLLFLKGKINFPFYKGFNSFEKSFGEFKLFCAFLEGDYDVVMKNNKQCSYLFASYLTTNDFPPLQHDLLYNRKDIMVGHCGSPILNHFEIVEQLTTLKVDNKILLPLSYGKKEYIDGLTKKVRSLKNDRVVFMQDFLPKDEYYSTLDNVGFFILNSFCQQALGNIVFFLWSGAKVFLRENTSTYKTLKKQSFHVFSIEHDLNAARLTPLTNEQKLHNHQLLSELISEENFKQQWLKILTFS